MIGFYGEYYKEHPLEQCSLCFSKHVNEPNHIISKLFL
jgi:hypothetical protein